LTIIVFNPLSKIIRKKFKNKCNLSQKIAELNEKFLSAEEETKKALTF